MSAETRPGFISFPTIDAFGDGGFRVAGERHEGAILIINGVVSAWRPQSLTELSPADFDAVFAAEPRPDLVLLGVGPRMRIPPEPVATAFREQTLGLEFMDTGAACRLYTTLIGEGRRLAAALLPA